MAADLVRLNKMVFHGYHGYWEEERQVGQRFEVDVELEVDVAQAAHSDHIRRSRRGRADHSNPRWRR